MHVFVKLALLAMSTGGFLRYVTLEKDVPSLAPPPGTNSTISSETVADIKAIVTKVNILPSSCSDRAQCGTGLDCPVTVGNQHGTLHIDVRPHQITTVDQFHNLIFAVDPENPVLFVVKSPDEAGKLNDVTINEDINTLFSKIIHVANECFDHVAAPKPRTPPDNRRPIAPVKPI